MRPRNLSVKPIGFVRKGRIVLNRPWVKGLRGLEGFSHLLVFTWLHQAHKTDLLLKPKKGLPPIGFLATRTPHRPNPIGFTVVKLVKRRGANLEVRGLDAREGTAILDLKPYTPREQLKGIRIPSWVEKLDRLENDPLRRYGAQLKNLL